MESKTETLGELKDLFMAVREDLEVVGGLIIIIIIIKQKKKKKKKSGFTGSTCSNNNRKMSPPLLCTLAQRFDELTFYSHNERPTHPPTPQNN